MPGNLPGARKRICGIILPDAMPEIIPNSTSEEKAARNEQKRHFQRNQALGLLLVALSVFCWRLMHAPAGWIFPQGWWHL